MTREEAHRIPLGTCCVCETPDNVCVLLNLNGRCPILGRGWGCLVCDLEPHGAVAVVCEGCATQLEAGVSRLKFICTGYPAKDGRTPFYMMRGSYEHDLSRHVVNPFSDTREG